MTLFLNYRPPVPTPSHPPKKKDFEMYALHDSRHILWLVGSKIQCHIHHCCMHLLHGPSNAIFLTMGSQMEEHVLHRGPFQCMTPILKLNACPSYPCLSNLKQLPKVMTHKRAMASRLTCMTHVSVLQLFYF